MKSTYSILAFLLSWLATVFAQADPPIRPGDRIAIVGNTFADQLRVHGYLETLLLQHSQEDPVSIRNLGWAGDMVTARDRPTNFPTEESTLRAHKTDVIIACFGMGESFGGEQALEDFKRRLESLIDSHAGKTYNGKSAVRMVLVSPIAYEDLGELTPNRQQRNRDLEAYTVAMREVASAAEVPFVDLLAPSRYLMDETAGPNLTTNGIHLTRYGYWALSRTFFEQLTSVNHAARNQPWQLIIDARAKTGDARGAKISKLAGDESGLSFQVTATSTPSLPPPTSEPLPPQLEFVRDRLVVENLKSGHYQLTVDGEPVATADEKAWGEGVAIDSSPAHRAAEAYRDAVNDKNLQFTYSWKALNQVHIVGERRSSPSGKALPQEVIRFNDLANERDQALRNPLELKTHSWRITPVGP